MSTNWPKNKNVGDIYVNPKGIKWKWNGKGWVSLKESEVVYLAGPTGPAGTSGPMAITYQFSHGSMDPIDNGIYYIGDIPDFPAQSNNSIASKRVKSLVTGEIKQISIMTQILGNLGTNESQIFILKNFTTNESATITSEYKHESNNQLNNYDLQSGLSVSKDDELEIIWQTPTFSTSPTLVRHNFSAYIEY